MSCVINGLIPKLLVSKGWLCLTIDKLSLSEFKNIYFFRQDSILAKTIYLYIHINPFKLLLHYISKVRMHFTIPELTVELFMCAFACRSIRTLLIASYKFFGGRRGRDRMVVGFTTTYAISAYQH